MDEQEERDRGSNDGVERFTVAQLVKEREDF